MDADAVDAQNDGTPTQLILPESDSGMRIRGYRADRLAWLIPGGACVVVGGFMGSHGLTRLGSLLVGVGVVLLSLGMYFIHSTPSYTSAIDRMRGRLAMTIHSRSFPLDREGAAGVHGVAGILDDGSVEMEDGRVVRFARVHGRNTDFQTDRETQTMVNSFRRSLDGSERLSETDFSLYSMTTTPNDRAITDKYTDVWLSERFDRENSRDIIGYLKSIIDGEPKAVAGWKATDWETYVVVTVAPEEIDPPELDTVAGGGDTIRRQQAVEAESRLSSLRSAFNAVPGVDAHPIDGPAHARVVARHWAGTHHPDDFEGPVDDDSGVTVSESDLAAVNDPTPGRSSPESSDDLPPLDPSLTDRLLARLGQLFAGVRGSVTERETSELPPRERHAKRIKQLLAASQLDTRPSHDMLVVGDQYVRTFWIGDWPTRPTANFLKALHTMRGIDMSVHHRFDARDTDEVKAELQGDAGDIDASITERSESASSLDADVLKDEMDEVVTFFKLIHHTDVQPWEITSYVTVRAGDRTAIEVAERLAQRGYDPDDITLDIAKRKALDDACEEVEEVLSGAGLEPVSEPQHQLKLFRAAAPTGRDDYATSSTREKSRLCPTGAVASTFPACSTTVNHEEGVEMGRNPTNGRVISIDAFETPPAHRLTLGKTGSGKTWSVMKQAVRWYLSGTEDRTLVMIDNKGDFAGVTGLLNGDRITISGRTTINPLRMEPMDDATTERAQIDPYRTKHRFVQGLTLDLIADTEKRRDQYRPLLRDGIDKAMEEAGLDPDDPTTHTPANSPTMADVRDAVATIADDPSAHARYEATEKNIEDNVGGLLHRLESFEQGGEFGFLTGTSAAAVEPGGVTYLDLQQIEGIGSTDHQTSMLSAALGEVHEAVKRAPEKTLVIVDEAHHLLKSERILDWLESGARHWRCTDAGLWFVSQHPKDFVTDADADQQQRKNVIRDQAQIVDLFHTTDREALADFGLNEGQISFLAEDASHADSKGVNHSDCLVNHPDVEGWLRAWVSVTSGEKSVFSYAEDKHGPYPNYIDRNWSTGTPDDHPGDARQPTDERGVRIDGDGPAVDHADAVGDGGDSPGGGGR